MPEPGDPLRRSAVPALAAACCKSALEILPQIVCVYWLWGACYGAHWHPPRKCIHVRRWAVDCG